MTPEPSPTSFFGRHRQLLTGVLLMVAAWILYLPTTQFDFAYYDDVRVLRDHPEVYGQTNLAANFKAIFVSSFPREEPLLVRDLTWALDSRIFGFANPFGYHLGNVLLHGVVVALLFSFLFSTTRRYGFAVGTAAAFLGLGVHVEPVAWIMGRKDILSAFFLLLALCAQTQRLTTARRAAQWWWYGATLAFFIGGLLSKISGLTFPLVLFLHAILLPYLRGERAPGAPLLWQRTWLREGFLLIPALAITGVTYVWYQGILAQMGIFDRGYTAQGLAHLKNLLMVNPMGCWLYLKQIFLPAQLAVLYTWPTLESAYAPGHIFAAVGTVVAALVMGVWLGWRRKDLFFYYATYFILMIPYLNLIYIGIWVADRYVYLASFCVLAMAITGWEIWWQRARGYLRLVALALLLVVAGGNLFQTVAYQAVWKNGETLWQYHIGLPNPSVVAYENLAVYYYSDFSKALALQNQPGMVAALQKMSAVVEGGLSAFWLDRQQPPPPQTAFLFFLRSLIEEVKGDANAALKSLLLADQLHPGFDSTNLNLSRIYRQLASAALEPAQRAAYVLAARDRFVVYIKSVYRGRQLPADVAAELADLEAAVAAQSSTSGK